MSIEDFITALEENHRFPGPYTLKVIGANSDEFRLAVFAVVREEMRLQYEPRHEIKQTPSGRHQSLTLHLTAKNAQQIASIYTRLRELEEVTMLM
ncbi:MAG: YbeD family protein [Planctomycetota bacterium]